jgi:outer membrane protein OmpU
MNNLKKVGLSALAGSLVAFSAQAMDMSVSGTAKITYVDEGEGSAGSTDVTGNPYGFDQTVAFNGSGETPLGTVSLMHVHAAAALSSSLLTIDMGDSGKITLDNGVGADGAGTIKDMMPRAAGAEQSWDDTDGDAYFIDTPTAGAWGYSNSVAGYNVSLGYAKNGGGMTGDDANADAGDDSSKSFAVTTASMMDGLNVGVGYASNDSATSQDSDKESTVFATYAIGPVTLGYQLTDINIAGDDATSALYGISMNINDNASISYNARDVELGDQIAVNGTALVDQEDSGIGASYTMGNMTLSAFNNQSENVAGASGTDDEVTQVTLSFAF